MSNKFIWILCCQLLFSWSVMGQSITEQFETETDNATSFSESGISFTLTGQLHIENSGASTFGVGPSSRYIDISNYCPASVGYKGSMYTSTKIIVDTIYVYPSINCVAPSSSGTIKIYGYNNSSVVDSVIVSSFPTYVYLSYNSGFAKVTSPFGSASVDSIGFMTTGSLTYVAIDQFVFREAGTTWNGTTWDNGAPTASVDAIIASNTTPGNFTCKNLTINSGFALTMAGGTTANINGNVTNSGNGFSGTGTFNIAASGALSGNAISTTGTITVASGATLTTNSLLTLAATSSSVFGTIGNSAGTISGNVTAEAYIPGKRAFRFFGHPFTTTQALTALTDDIDITGSGGSTNGFTTTGTNNPSAYWYDVSTANGSASNDVGWTAFTHTNGAGANGWDQYEMLRVLVRGAKGEGLTGGSYTPSATTIDMTGTVNQGTQVVNVTKGSGSIYAGVANPFPSGIQMNAVTRGGTIATFYYVWDATSGAAGAYTAKLYTSSYILPPFAAFVTGIAASSTITFDEADKASGGAGIFKGTAPRSQVQLIISDSNTKWDELLISLDDNAMSTAEYLVDAPKFYNPGLDFFTLSTDNERQAIDVRPYADGASIQLGLTAYNRYNKYVIRTGDFDIPAGTKMYLNDKYLNTKQEIKQGFEYWFDVTTDTLSQGNKRFEINMVGKPTTGVATANANAPKMCLMPNPAYSEVKVAFDKIEGEATVKMMSITGKVVYHQKVNTTGGSVTIPLQQVPAGIYIVELQSKNARFTEKLIKE